MKFLIIAAMLMANTVFAQTTASWKTTKRMFLVSKQEAVGISSKVTVETGSGDTRYIKLMIPIDSFDSGEPDRDKEVLIILKADKQPSLVYKTKDLTPEEFNQVRAGEIPELDGTLTIGKKDFPMKVKLSLSINFLTGKMEGTFTQFDIEPPTVAGGVVAKVNDELTLEARVDRKDLEQLN